MARLSRFLTVAVLLGGATVSLSACTGDPAPTATPSPSVVVSETPPPSPSPTALSDDELLAMIPEGARAENFGSAVNFASFFMLEYHDMFADQDSALFRFNSGPDCQFCASALSSFDELIGAGGRSDGGEVSLDLAGATGGLRGDGYWYVGLPLVVAPNSDYSADGELLDQGPGATGTASLRLEWHESRWIVAGVEIVAA